jgi:nucleotide-binding universal stress UspA family protein
VRIVLATNGSEGATRALDWVARCLKEAAVHVVTVAEADPPRLASLPRVSGPEPACEVLRDTCLTEAQRTLARAQARLIAAGVAPAATHLLQGEASRGIVDLARGLQADVIVLGPRGRGCLPNLWRGSVSGQVLRAWPGAVLLVNGAFSAPAAAA